MDSYTISKYDPADKKAVVDFINEYFGEQRTHTDFEDKFLSNEFGHGILVVAKNDEGAIIGTQSLLPYPLTNGKAVLKSGKSEDTLVHPDYRGKGITAEMYAKLFLLAKAKGYSMIWGFSHLRKEFFERAEMKVVYNSTLMYFPYNIFNTVRFILHQQKWSWKKRLGFFFKAIWSDQQTEQIEYSFIPLSLEEYGSKYEEMGSIYFRVPFKNTEFKQHFFYQITSKKTGESALLAFEELDHAIFISEIRMHSDFSPYDTETLMKAILSFLRAKNKLILFWAFNNPNNLEVNRSLRSIGFRNFKEGLRVCWKDLEEDSIHPNQLLISRLMAFHI